MIMCRSFAATEGTSWLPNTPFSFERFDAAAADG
jgi:hypothetical protein